MTKALLWDNDGVLVDTERLYFEATRDILMSAGFELTEDQYVELFLRQGRGAWHLLEEQGVSRQDVDRLRDARNALYGRWLSHGPRVVAGIARVLDTLRGEYVMGVVTSCRRDHFDLIHRSSRLLPYFDFVVAAGDYARSKPHPDPYLLGIQKSGVEPEACVAIEDSERGLAAATAAGIRCIVIPTDLTRGTAFSGAYRVLANAAELPGALIP